jgi:hypothetical protein
MGSILGCAKSRVLALNKALVQKYKKNKKKVRL